MNNETEKIIKKAVDDVNKKYEQEALYEAEQKGLKKGKEDAKKEIAKKLKGLHTPEQIAKITGLNLNTIMLL